MKLYKGKIYDMKTREVIKGSGVREGIGNYTLTEHTEDPATLMKAN